MEGYYNFNKINEHAKISDKENYHRGYKDNIFSEKHFIKNKSDWRYARTLDINNLQVKEYMIQHPDKFKTMCLVNLYHSQGNKFNNIYKHEFTNLFKDYLSKYIDNSSLTKINKKEMINRNLTNFDIKYNLIFKECKKKHRYSQKCKLKKEYQKYLECGDIEQCNLKDLLYMIIYAIDTECEQSLHSSPSLDSISSGV